MDTNHGYVWWEQLLSFVPVLEKVVFSVLCEGTHHDQLQLSADGHSGP